MASSDEEEELIPGQLNGDFDELLDNHLGSFGPWQVSLLIYTSIFILISNFSLALQYFVLWTPQTECIVDDLTQMKQDANSCFFINATDGSRFACNKISYDESVFSNSMVTEFNLCPKEYLSYPLATFLGSAYMIGLCIGMIPTGIVTDKLGRLPVLIVSNTINGLVDSLGALAPNAWVWFYLRIIAGTFNEGVHVVAFLILMESVGKKLRGKLGIWISIPYALSNIPVAALAYWLQDWRSVQLALSLISLSASCLYFVLQESPRWLLSVGKFNAAEKIIKFAAKKNKKIVPKSFQLSCDDDDDDDDDDSTFGEEKVDVKRTSSMFNTKMMLYLTVMSINTLTVNSCYYGLTMMSVNLEGNIYLNYVVSTLVEIPAYVLCGFWADSWGRKKLIVVFQIVTGIACLLTAFLTGHLLTASTFIGKFGTSAAFSVIYLYTAEIFPTEVRGMAITMTTILGSFGWLAAPFLSGANNDPTSLVTPLIIMGTLSSLSGFGVCLLPETKESKLPDKLEDL